MSSQNPSASTSTSQAIGQPLILAVACVIGSAALHVGSQPCGFPPATSPPNLFSQSCWTKSPCWQVPSGRCTPDLTHDVFQLMASRVVPGAALATRPLGEHPIPPPTCQMIDTLSHTLGLGGVRHRHIGHAPRAGKGMIMAPEGRRDSLPGWRQASQKRGRRKG